MATKPRIRKALSVRENAEAARIKTSEPKKSSKFSGARAKLPRSTIFAPIGKLLSLVFRPLKKPFGWLVPRYFINSWREVRQVTWPTRSETWRLTGAVLIFAIVFGSLVAGVDKVLDEVFKKVILK